MVGWHPIAGQVLGDYKFVVDRPCGDKHLAQVATTCTVWLPWRVARGISLNSRPGSPARTHGRCRRIGRRCVRHCGHRTGRGV